jgi:hypothetical protein
MEMHRHRHRLRSMTHPIYRQQSMMVFPSMN